MHHSQSQASAQVQDLSEDDQRGQRKAGTAEKNLPFRDMPPPNETTAMEFLHLLDPKNYKFLPPQFTNQIRAAGKVTAASNAVSDLLNLEQN